MQGEVLVTPEWHEADVTASTSLVARHTPPQGLLGDDKAAPPKKMDREQLYTGLARILRESKEFKGYIAVGSVFLVLSSLLQNALPALAGKMLDAVTPKGERAPSACRLSSSCPLSPQPAGSETIV